MNTSENQVSKEKIKNKAFQEWLKVCDKLQPNTPKQIDWFFEMYKNGYTPTEAINDMLLVV